MKKLPWRLLCLFLTPYLSALPLLCMQQAPALPMQHTATEAALIKYTKLNNPQRVLSCLELGTNPNLITDSTNRSPLHESCILEDNTQELIELLLGYGADPSHQTTYGACPLQEAMCMVNLSAIKALVENHDYRLASSSTTPFHLAAASNHQATKKFLLFISLLNNSKNTQALRAALMCLKRNVPDLYKLRYELILPCLEMYFSETMLLLMLQSKEIKQITLAENIFKNRAFRLQKILQVKAIDTHTAYDIEKTKNPIVALYNPETLERDLAAFLEAAKATTLDQLSDNNVFKAAHEGNLPIPPKLTGAQKFKKKATEVATSLLIAVLSQFTPKS